MKYLEEFRKLKGENKFYPDLFNEAIELFDLRNFEINLITKETGNSYLSSEALKNPMNMRFKNVNSGGDYAHNFISCYMIGDEDVCIEMPTFGDDKGNYSIKEMDGVYECKFEIKNKKNSRLIIKTKVNIQ
jgi:hypothetical protein